MLFKKEIEMKKSFTAAIFLVLCISLTLTANTAFGERTVYIGTDFEDGIDTWVLLQSYGAGTQSLTVEDTAAPFTGESKSGYYLKSGPGSIHLLEIQGQAPQPGYVLETVFMVPEGVEIVDGCRVMNFTNLGGQFWLVAGSGPDSFTLRSNIGVSDIELPRNQWHKLEGRNQANNVVNPGNRNKYYLNDVFWYESAVGCAAPGNYGDECYLGNNGDDAARWGVYLDRVMCSEPYIPPQPGDLPCTTTKIHPDYTLSWESEVGKVYRVYWSPEAIHPGSALWQKASGAIIAEDTISTWKDEGDSPNRVDPANNLVTKRFYKVMQLRENVYYVDTNDTDASDDNPGSEEEPWKTIYKAGEVLTAGDVVLVKGGTYRPAIPRNPSQVVRIYNEGTGPYDMITFAAYPGDSVTIKGSFVYSDWLHDTGNIYKHDHHSYKRADPAVHTNLVTDYWDLVMVDGTELLQQVRFKADMTPGTFWVDFDQSPAEDDTMHIWLSDSSDPAGHNVEVAVRPVAFWPVNEGMDYIRIKGFKFEHFTSSGQAGAVQFRNSTGWLFENNEIVWVNGIGLSCSGWEHTVRNSTFNDCGNVGLYADANDVSNPQPQHLLIENNEFRRNNWKNYPMGWQSGGIKGGWVSYSMIRNNIFTDNNGPGLWLDVGIYEVDVYNNYFDNNAFMAIRLEVDQYVDVYNNIIMNTRPNPDNNHQCGVYIVGDHNRVFNNVFYNEEIAFYLWHEPNLSYPYYVYDGTHDNEIYNNIFIDLNDRLISFGDETNFENNTIDYNLYDPIGGYKDVFLYGGGGNFDNDYGDRGYSVDYAHSGAHSYKIASYSDTKSYTLIAPQSGTTPFGISEYPYKARAFFYVPTDVNINAWTLFFFDQKELNITSVTPTTATVDIAGYSTTVTRGAWHEFEFYRINGTTLQVSIDSAVLYTFTSMSNGQYANSFEFGDGRVYRYGTVYYDDIKIWKPGGTVYWEEDCEDFGGAHDIIGNAGVVNPGVDFHLTAESDAINVGLYIDLADPDYDGVPRSDPPEIGPYEYVE